jgi:surface antigen
MRPGRLLAAHIVFWASGTFALAVQADTPFEETVQYALEHLTSGISAASMIQGTQVTVVPTRTWKSVTGHYCRRYEITVTEPGAAPDHGERTRCRDGDGVWKQVRED